MTVGNVHQGGISFICYNRRITHLPKMPAEHYLYVQHLLSLTAAGGSIQYRFFKSTSKCVHIRYHNYRAKSLFLVQYSDMKENVPFALTGDLIILR